MLRLNKSLACRRCAERETGCVSSRLVRRGGLKNGESEHQRRVANWQHTAAVALLPALVAMPLAAASTSTWDVGDLAVGFYFALTSLVLYLQSLRVRRAVIDAPAWSHGRDGDGYLLVMGLVLVVLDIGSAGRV